MNEMKLISILIVLLIAVSASGCMGNKQGDTSAGTPVSQVTTAVSGTSSAGGTQESSNMDEFGTEADIAAIDSLVNDSSMDISFSDVSI